MQAGQKRQLQGQRSLLDEGGLFGNGVHASHRYFRQTNGDHHTRQPCPRTNVEQVGLAQPGLCKMTAQGLNHRQAVEQVVRQHLGRVTHCREVVDLGPLGNQVQVVEQLADLHIVQFQLQRGQPAAQFLFTGSHQASACSVVLSGTVFFQRFFFRCTSSSEMVAGVIPEMREAKPRVSGRYLARVCRASKLRADTCR